jgi:hypothetical protein
MTAVRSGAQGGRRIPADLLLHQLMAADFTVFLAIPLWRCAVV